jgi:superfamily II DNA or RNA helicase
MTGFTPTINIRGTDCTIIGVEPDILKYLEDKYNYKLLNYEHTDASKAEEAWDGTVHCVKNGRFRVGLLNDVVRSLVEKLIQVDIKDHRVLGNKLIFKNDNIHEMLWPYQKDIVANALLNKTSSAEVATGGGKTLIAAEFIRQVARKTLVIVPSIEIQKQVVGTLTKYLNYNVTTLKGPINQGTNVTVTTWQAVKPRHYDYLQTVDCLVIDEAQHIGANNLRKIAEDVPAIYRLGLSGTLFREDGADLEIIAATGPKIASISYSYLTENRYIVPAEIRIVDVPFHRYAKWTTYENIYYDYILNNENRNKLIYEAVHQLVNNGRKVLIFVTRIEHGKTLEADLKKITNDSGFLYSDHPNREDIILAFKTGMIKCLISTSVLQEGFDLPVIDALVLAAPSNSSIVTLQRIGRALRNYNNKTNAIVVDFYDHCKYLEDHFNKRYARYKQEQSWTITKMKTKQSVINDEWE